jgi:hypothetical protein
MLIMDSGAMVCLATGLMTADMAKMYVDGYKSALNTNTRKYMMETEVSV